MIIRKMTAEDYAEVYDLWLSCKGMGLNSVDDTPEGIAKFLKRNPDTNFVAEEDDTIIGVIMSGHDGRRGYIYHTAVAPGYRHQGIGSLLFNAVMSAMDKEGIAKVAGVVFSGNTEGNAFWEKQGMTRREDLVYRNKNIKNFTRFDT